MIDFIGRFVDGPLAGSTFEGSIGDSGSGGFDIIPVFGLSFVIAVFITVVGFIVLSPFLSWKVIFAEAAREQNSLLGPITLVVIEFIYIFFRIRSNIKHWNVSFMKEVAYNILFYFILIVLALLILTIPLSYIYLGSEFVSMLLSNYWEFMGYVFSSLFSQIIMVVLFLLTLSVIPSLLILIASRLMIGKIARIKKLK